MKTIKTFATITLIAASLLLAGCTASASAPDKVTATATSPAQAAQTQPSQRQIKAVKVISPMAIVVTPFDKVDPLYGTEFTVRISDVIAPAKGECGYDQALALAKQTLVGHVWFLVYRSAEAGPRSDKAGYHHGAFDSRGMGYGRTMIRAGLGYLPADAPYYAYSAEDQQTVRDAGTGLWGSCPGFGE